MASHAASVASTSSAPDFTAPQLQSNHIDLTLDDEPNDHGRQIKRLRTEYGSRDVSQSNSPTPSYSTPSPSSSFSAIAPLSQIKQLSLQPHPSSQLQLPPIKASSSYRPHFASNSAAFFPDRLPGPLPSTYDSAAPSNLPNTHANNPGGTQQSETNRPTHQIIDLTSSPSPPPISQRASASSSAEPKNPPATLSVPPKTPVCIGQLSVTALVLYPVPYLQPQMIANGIPGQSEWAPVKLAHDPTAKGRSSSGDETINIRTPAVKTASGEIIQGESFGVVEQKAANVLGPMLGKGLIRADAKVRRGVPNLPILPLQMLVHTPNGNIPIVARYLQQYGLLLDHPSSFWEPDRISQLLYLNPHNPPPGGHARLLNTSSRPGYSGPGGNRWVNQQVSAKSVEVQRNQVDEVFKILRSGDELEETEATSDIASKLYPHQKKALTFLLEREREITFASGQSSSLWQVRTNAITKAKSWHNMVTQREVFDQPPDCRGALLADDMGLGKTITCVSLIAATLSSAQRFASMPLQPPPKPPLEHMDSDPSLSASHFAGAVWGMPSVLDDPSMPMKKRAKMQRESDKWEARYTRQRRIKVRSRGTLIICPLSTVSNWEDQFREHWAGDVSVVGGAGSCPSASSQTQQPGSSSQDSPMPDDSDTKASPHNVNPESPRPLRVYVYHGNARRPDPTFLADFDAVITTYSTLATEYSKQTRSAAIQDPDDEEAESNTGDDGDPDWNSGNATSSSFPEQSMEVNENGNGSILLLKPKEKKGVKRKKTASTINPCEASSPLQSVNWFRVVLDEAHSIKETTTVASRASCDLEAERRLCLTGTPVQNKLDDVFALIKFLRLYPFDDRTVWQEFIGVPVKFGQPLGVARLQTIMKCITLRRTKESKTQSGQRILSLPPRNDELRYLKFDPQEQIIYDKFFKESREEFAEMSNKNEVMKNYVGILQRILRLRQICDHFELVDGKGPTTDTGCNYGEIVDAIAKEGITEARAAAIFTLIRDSGTAQCVECGCELGVPVDTDQAEGTETEACGSAAKKSRKTKTAPSSRVPTRANSPVTPRVIMSRCQHLFCILCFQNCVHPGWPSVAADVARCCSVCQAGLYPSDAVELRPDCTSSIQTNQEGGSSSKKKASSKKEKRQKGVVPENFHPSTKVNALMSDLVNFSRSNPYSSNYDPSSIEIQMVDSKGNNLEDGVVKTVVFSQWTTMLDKVEDALEMAGIKYDRLDGTMKRDDRIKAMDALKYDPACEVLLVSLKAGGVGLNLTAAQRVYLMDPYWNPAVENQAVDRIHRLGQKRPVTTVKLIIENTIEDRLLEVQKKKTELANMTLGQHLSKAEIHQRRIEELNQLFQQ